MAEDVLQVAAGQTGDKVRTARKSVGGQQVHEEYVVPDVPWTIMGSYYWAARFAGLTGVGTAGILAALFRPTSNAYDVVLRKMTITYANEGASNANIIAFTRSGALPGAASAESAATIGKKLTTHPTQTSNIYVKPSGITMSAGELAEGYEWTTKPSTAAATGTLVEDFTADAEPYVLTATEAFVIYQLAAGTATEFWTIGLEWHEVVF